MMIEEGEEGENGCLRKAEAPTHQRAGRKGRVKLSFFRMFLVWRMQVT